MNKQNVDVITIRQHFPSRFAPTSSFWVYEQVRDLIVKGITFKVISPQPFIPSFLRSKSKYPTKLPIYDNFNGVDVIRPTHFRIPNYKLYQITNWSLRRVVKISAQKTKAKLIHAHFGNDGVASLLLKKHLSIPLITSFYGYDLSDQIDVLNAFYKKLSKEGDLFLALSEDMKQDLISLGFKKDKIKIHHLGVNIEELNNYSQKQKTTNIFKFLVVARFSERKGIHDTIIAFDKVVKRKQNVELRIVGNGSYKSTLVKLVEDLNITDKVKFIDNSVTNNPRETVLQEMANCDIFLLNSYITKTGSKEGTPIVLMEAQGMGKPCIATHHAGIPEIVINGITGVTVKERDVVEISKAMLKMMNNPELASKYGLNGKKHIAQEFNNIIQQNRLFNIYQNYLLK
ncbi:MAG: glycosyltransferase [Candidatus Peribacteraceae bacterium]|nr:glycosyltransferase [Candidatus Peribacteraceae bacterium]